MHENTKKCVLTIYPLRFFQFGIHGCSGFQLIDQLPLSTYSPELRLECGEDNCFL